MSKEASGPFRIALVRLPYFDGVEVAALLHMARVRENGHVRNAQEASGNDSSYFKPVEVLFFYLLQNPIQRALDLRRSQRAKEHRFDFCRHEKEIPTGSMDLAIKREAIQNF